MFTQQKTTAGKLTNYGLGWYVRETGDRRWIYHNGGQHGVSSILLLVPTEQVAVAVIVNLENVDLVPLAFQVATVAARAPLPASAAWRLGDNLQTYRHFR